jgi:hypothetical protein
MTLTGKDIRKQVLEILDLRTGSTGVKPRTTWIGVTQKGEVEMSNPDPIPCPCCGRILVEGKKKSKESPAPKTEEDRKNKDSKPRMERFFDEPFLVGPSLKSRKFVPKRVVYKAVTEETKPSTLGIVELDFGTNAEIAKPLEGFLTTVGESKAKPFAMLPRILSVPRNELRVQIYEFRHEIPQIRRVDTISKIPGINNVTFRPVGIVYSTHPSNADGEFKNTELALFLFDRFGILGSVQMASPEAPECPLCSGDSKSKKRRDGTS